jgi:hypothetical protein
VQCLTPVTRRVEFLTDIAIAANSTEQRAKKRPALTRFVLPYSRINRTDLGTMRTFFESKKGSWDSTWSFTLGATTYAHLAFEDSEFRFTESAGSATTYSFQLRARQTQNPGMAAGAAGAAFPVLSSGLRAQLPYSQMRRFAVTLNDNPIGPRYAWSWQAAGLTGFPTRSLRGWELAYPVLTDADLAAIETHFRSQWGQWARFQWTDPDDGTDYPKCRYAADALEITHNAANQSSLTLRIMETN